ncbi:MAG: hypothetical protein KIS76_03915 [Pyrinomonadaceae bacterium]|nr:hypothetical protein [Pyrinomonadaceae bacterium]
MKVDRAKFFKGVRAYHSQVRGGGLDQSQVDGLNFLIEKFERSRGWTDIRHIAYALATIAHETAWTFKPIREYRSRAGTKARANQDRYWLSGYYGRGYVQLTWQRNYRKAGKDLGIDLDKNPDLALEPEHAFAIMTAGMFGGWFTGKALGDYINDSKTDYRNARRIINGLDKADEIAGHAKKFEAILKNSAAAAETSKDSTAENGIGRDENAEPPKTETKVEVRDGSVSVSTSENAPLPQRVAIEKPEGTGFIKEVKTEVGALVAGNGGVQACIDQAQQASAFGFSSRFWTILGLIVLAGSVVYLIYKYLDWRNDQKRELELTNNLIQANSTDGNQVVLVDKSNLPALETLGYEIIYR